MKHPASLPEHLRRQLHTVAEDAPLCVAFSGGHDSSALLHALSRLVQPEQRRLRAVHVDHGLHPHSADWARWCARTCAELRVPLAVRHVHVDLRDQGVEAAARHARYAAMKELLRDGELLLTAHHQDDQAETLLLKLLRGAGPHGLGGMRELRPLGAGQLWRPLLGLPGSVLRAYGQANDLRPIDDPANDDAGMARNVLRHSVLPAIQARWPHAASLLARAAGQQREVAAYLDAQVDIALRGVRAGPTLHAPAWLQLHDALRGLVLERWLHDQQLPAPTRPQRAQLECQLREARPGRQPRITWPGAEVRPWGGHLYAMQPLSSPPRDWQAEWHTPELQLPDHAGRLAWTRTPQKHPALSVRLDVRGARLKPAGDRFTREVRDLYQQARIPPWRRRRCPFIHDQHGTLLSVGGLWHSAEGQLLFEQIGACPLWHPGC